MLADPFRKENGKLEQHLTPVLDTTGPFTRDVHRDEIQHLEQGLIRRENAFSFGYFAQLAVVTFNHVCRVDQFADFRRIFEERRKLVPVGVNAGIHLTH